MDRKIILMGEQVQPSSSFSFRTRLFPFDALYKMLNDYYVHMVVNR